MYVYVTCVHDIPNEWHGITSFSNCGTSCTDPMSSDNSGHLPCDFIPQFSADDDISHEVIT